MCSTVCDELGIPVWQDFVFANMDYPAEDPAFVENINAEASYQLRRLSRYPSVPRVYCGNSEARTASRNVGHSARAVAQSLFRRTVAGAVS